MWTVIILRFFAGSFGSSPLTNAGGVIADCFPARERGLAMSIFSTAPFLGPTLGPVIGGFLGESAGWRWLMGFMAAFSGFFWIVGFLLVPETYAPVLLRKRAETLSKKTGKIYRSKLDIERGQVSIGEAFKTALSRPWILLFREPIVLLLSIYLAIVYGTLYLMFAAYPIVYQEARGWSEGIGGLPFLGILVGMIFAVVYIIFYDNRRYQKTTDRHGGYASPEARLPSAMVGGIALPVGLFWFAWTNYPTLPWQASVAAGIPFGFGMCLVFLAIMVSRVRFRVINQALTAFVELPYRRIYNLCSFCARRKRRIAFLLRRRVPSLHDLHVQQPWHSLGVVHPSIPGARMCPLPIPLLQVRSANSHAMQVRRRSRCIHEAHPWPRRTAAERRRRLRDGDR